MSSKTKNTILRIERMKACCLNMATNECPNDCSSCSLETKPGEVITTLGDAIEELKKFEKFEAAMNEILEKLKNDELYAGKKTKGVYSRYRQLMEKHIKELEE